MELGFAVEAELAMAWALAPDVELEVPPASFTSVCVSDWIWVSSPSESNCASWTTNWLGSSGSSGLWFLSCVVSNCRNVLVKSTPGSVVEVRSEEHTSELQSLRHL